MVFRCMREASGAYLVLATPQSLEGGGAVRVTGSDGHEDLTDVDTGNETVGLSEGTTHSGLQSIGTSARQHLVDTDDVVGVGADAEVEGLLTGGLHHVPWRCVSRKSSFSPGACRGYVLVGANTGSLEGLGGDLLILVGDEVNAEGELVDVGLLATEIEDANLGVGHTTVEARLRVRLSSMTVSGMFSRFVFSSPLAPFPPSLALLVDPGVHRWAAAIGRIVHTLFLQ